MSFLAFVDSHDQSCIATNYISWGKGKSYFDSVTSSYHEESSNYTNGMVPNHSELIGTSNVVITSKSACYSNSAKLNILAACIKCWNLLFHREFYAVHHSRPLYWTLQKWTCIEEPYVHDYNTFVIQFIDDQIDSDQYACLCDLEMPQKCLYLWNRYVAWFTISQLHCIHQQVLSRHAIIFFSEVCLPTPISVSISHPVSNRYWECQEDLCQYGHTSHTISNQANRLVWPSIEAVQWSNSVRNPKSSWLWLEKYI